MGAPIAGPPAGYANSDEKTWALIAHFGGIIVGFVAGLVALLAKGNESPTVRAHAVEALNFQITMSATIVLAWIIAVCTAPFTFGVLAILPIGAWVVLIAFSVIGGMRANEGQLYKYPISVRLVK